jgi:hypothetical protein
MSGPAAAGGVNPERDAFIADFMAKAVICRYGNDCRRPKTGNTKCFFPHSREEAEKKAREIWRNKTDANRVAAKERRVVLGKECRAIEACKRCVNGEACGCTALPVAHELAREEMVFQIKILPCPHFVAYGECAHREWPNAEGWSCKNYCHPEDDIEAMHAKLAAQGWKNTRWESKTRDTLKKMGVDETPQIVARLDMFRLVAAATVAPATGDEIKVAEVTEDESPLSEEEELEAQEILDDMLDGETVSVVSDDDGGPDEVIVDGDEVDAEFAEFQAEEEVQNDMIDAFHWAFLTIAGMNDRVIMQQQAAQLQMLRAEEQRWIEACAQEVAAKAARSFAAVCRTPVVSSPPPRNIGALLGDVPRKAVRTPTVVPAVKGAPPKLGTLADLENDARELSIKRWWGDLCMD